MSLCSNLIFRGIAQLVEQRSPNVNRDLIPRIITGFLRLETSVSSLFSCLFFLQAVKVIYAKSRSKPAKDFGTASKDQQFFIRLEKAVSRYLKTSDWYFFELDKLKFQSCLAHQKPIWFTPHHKSKSRPDKVKTLHSTGNVKCSARRLTCRCSQPDVSIFSTVEKEL